MSGECPGKFPGNFRENCRKLPEKKPGIFQDFFGKFPGNFREIVSPEAVTEHLQWMHDDALLDFLVFGPFGYLASQLLGGENTHLLTGHWILTGQMFENHGTKTWES